MVAYEDQITFTFTGMGPGEAMDHCGIMANVFWHQTGGNALPSKHENQEGWRKILEEDAGKI
jgi:hypothetical protein